jgi:glycosyltransferase involved in cell wall biosynthesis
MKVSVVIPTYNRKHLICYALDSVLEQTFSDYEIIVVDDGSTDGTAELLETRYGNRIICLRQNNQGFGAARNHGVDAAKGEYIAFLDSDDLWYRNKLEKQVAIMDKLPNLAFLFSEFSILKDSGELIHSGLRTWHGEPSPVDTFFNQKTRFSRIIQGKNKPVPDFDINIGNIYHALLHNVLVLPSCAIVRSRLLTPEIKHTVGDRLCADWDFFALLSRLHDCAFMDIETAVNRGHHDEVRLQTNLSSTERAELRLASIARVWKSDPGFLKQHADDVKEVEGALLLSLAKQNILSSETKQARTVLSRWRELQLSKRKNVIYFFLKFFTFCPGLANLAVSLRNCIDGSPRKQ